MSVTAFSLGMFQVGQYIKREHVKDLHDLHQGKAGTPTMGGVLIIVSALISLLLWSTIFNRVLLIAVAVLCMMGAVGFLDDFIKLRNKKNDGLSAKTKLVGQILLGTFLGVAATLYPVTYGPVYLTNADVKDWPMLLSSFQANRPDDTSASARSALRTACQLSTYESYDGGAVGAIAAGGRAERVSGQQDWHACTIQGHVTPSVSAALLGPLSESELWTGRCTNHAVVWTKKN